MDVLKLLDAFQKYGGVEPTTITPTQNKDGSYFVTHAATGNPAAAVVVNTLGGFYNASYNGQDLTTDRGKITGGTVGAQGFILLHELGHLNQVFVPDASDMDLVNKNDKTLENDKNCGQTVKALRKLK